MSDKRNKNHRRESGRGAVLPSDFGSVADGVDSFYFLNTDHTDPKRVKHEREKARELKKTVWWKQKIQSGICEICGKKFKPELLTLDHVVPIARGGESVKSNVVPACKECNAKKKLDTPVDEILRKLSGE